MAAGGSCTMQDARCTSTRQPRSSRAPSRTMLEPGETSSGGTTRTSPDESCHTRNPTEGRSPDVDSVILRETSKTRVENQLFLNFEVSQLPL